MNPPVAGRCLNCDVELHGRFCAGCGQRAVPPYPTVRELAGDAWHELTGYDGRIAATFRALLHPGRLTRDYLEGHRAKYLPPIRLYLIVSVVYFVMAAAAPVVRTPGGQTVFGPGIRIGVTGRPASADQTLTPEERDQIRTSAERAPWIFRPILRATAEDPDGFRARIFTTMPRVFFAMLPVFAVIVGLFYRHRRFPMHLVFAVHIHAFAFMALTLSEAAKFSRSPTATAVIAGVVSIALGAYGLLALRAVYGSGWMRTIAQAIGIGVIYLIASIPAFLIILAWAAMR